MQAAMGRAFPPDNVWGKPPDIVQGDVAKGLADAAVRIDQVYTTAMQHHNAIEPHAILAAIAARHVNRPVKLVLTRQQEFAGVGYRPQIQHQIQIGATTTGQLTAITHHAIARTSTFDNRVVAPVTRTNRKLYACPNVATTYRLPPSHLSGPYTMRGLGETPGLFAIECAMDELAYALQIDPISLRLRNYADVDPETGKPWSSNSLKECYQQGAKRFGWH